jgi:hypothetical protein
MILTLCGFTMMTVSTFALDQHFVNQVMQSAKNIERDAKLLSDAVKAKAIDTDDVRKKISAMTADIAALQKQVADFEAGNPAFSEHEKADWDKFKQKVQLIEIFHNQKQQLAEADLVRNRKLVRAHATGVAKRAEMLQQTLSRLARSPVS